MSIWNERECPTDSRDAYYEGRRSREYDRNPFEHGRDAFADRDCREAYEEWDRGARYARYDREEAEREAEARRAHERREAERRNYDNMYPPGSACGPGCGYCGGCN